MLQSRSGTPISEIEDRFGISERTAFRDIQALEASGVPIVLHKGKGYSVAHGHFLPPLSFSLDEAKSLIYLEELAKKYLDASALSNVQVAIEKVRNKLNANDLDQLESLHSNVKAYVDGDFKNEYLTLVENAITDKTGLSIQYKNASGQVSNRAVEPIGLTFYSQGWHMIAFCTLRNDYRDFSLNRIQSLTKTDKTANRQHISLSEYIQRLEAESSH